MDAIQMIADTLLAQDQRLRPFDPKRDRPKDIGLGGDSTEYLMSEMDSDGRPMNIPAIWWDASGKPQMLEPDAAIDRAAAYEAETGMVFPRYDTMGGAVMAARSRSEMGGASYKPLIKQPWRR